MPLPEISLTINPRNPTKIATMYVDRILITEHVFLLFIITVVNQISLMILKIRIENESSGMNVKGNLSFEST